MIDPNISAVLRSKYAIRRFFYIFSVLLICLLEAIVLFKIIDVPYISESFIIAACTAAAAIFVFLFSYWFYLDITPSGLRNATIIPIQSAEIAESIASLTTHTSNYRFLGRSGSYVRTDVFPTLSDKSAESHQYVEVKVLVPQPSASNSDTYRRIKAALGEKATDSTLGAHVLATIAVLAELAAKNKYFRPSIRLMHTVPVLRFDISDAVVLVTRDAKKLPAILVNTGNDHYGMFLDFFENEFEQAEELPLTPLVDEIAQLPAMSKDEILEKVSSMAGEWAANCGEEGKQLYNNGQHRYA